MAGCGLDGTPHARDADLVADLSANRAWLERIVVTAEADTHVSRVAPDFVRDGTGPGATLPPERWEEYRRLFRKTGVREGFSKPWWGKEVLLLLCSTQGSVAGGTAKGYAYSRKALAPLVPSLDDPDQTVDHTQDSRAFVHLGDGWYLFFERS